MLIDQQSILEPHNITDRGPLIKERPRVFYVQVFDCLQESSEVHGTWKKVRKGRKPTKRYVRAQYRLQVLP